MEYVQDHVSKATTIRFKINPDTVPKLLEIPDSSTSYALIWTTTPWTLPANKAVSYSENLDYSIIKIDNSADVYLIASELIAAFEKLTEKSVVVLKTVSGTTDLIKIY